MAAISEDENAKEVIAPSMEAKRLRQPSRKKHEEEIEVLQATIREKEKKIKSFAGHDGSSTSLKDIKAEREATIERRKKIDADLKLVNQEITKKMGCLTKLQSSLHYKTEEKINTAIRKLDWQLNHQNFKLSEEKKIVAEVDSLKRSKKILGQYLAQKKEIEEMRDRARRMREERDHYYRAVTNLKNKEDELRKSNSESKTKHTALKQEIDELYEKKRQLSADFRRQEKDYQERKEGFRRRHRLETIRRKEEERRAKNEAIQKEYEEYRVPKMPYEDNINLCTTLATYLQRCCGSQEADTQSGGEAAVASKVQNTLVSELDGGMYVLRKKSEDEDYSVPRRLKRRKNKKPYVAKLLIHTPQIFAQFDSLNLNAPSNMTEVPASIEQLIARKKYYEEMAAEFLCNESLNESIIRQASEHGSWPFNVWAQTTINEDQSQSENGLSMTESGGGEMSRQPSKTESSGSLQDVQNNDQVIEELIRLSTDDSLQETESQNQCQDNILSDTCNLLSSNKTQITINRAKQNDGELDTCICKSLNSDCLCMRSECDIDSNDESSTVTDDDSNCTCSRQNSSTADCAVTEGNEIDYEVESCDHSIDAELSIVEQHTCNTVDYNGDSHIATIKDSGIIENMLTDVGGGFMTIAKVPHTDMCKLDRNGCAVADMSENVI